MADLNLSVPTGEVSLGAGTPKTVLLMKAPANQRLKILGFEIFFKGTSPTDTPVKCELIRVTSDGTGSAITPAANDDDEAETPQGTYKANYTVEPSYGSATLRVWEIQPQTGIIYMFPQGQEVRVKGGNLIGLRMTATQAETVSVNAIVEE
jgi:hypothetical protein